MPSPQKKGTLNEWMSLVWGELVWDNRATLRTPNMNLPWSVRAVKAALALTNRYRHSGTSCDVCSEDMCLKLLRSAFDVSFISEGRPRTLLAERRRWVGGGGSLGGGFGEEGEPSFQPRLPDWRDKKGFVCNYTGFSLAPDAKTDWWHGGQDITLSSCIISCRPMWIASLVIGSKNDPRPLNVFAVQCLFCFCLFTRIFFKVKKAILSGNNIICSVMHIWRKKPIQAERQ